MQSLKSQILIHLKFSPISSKESFKAEQIFFTSRTNEISIIWEGHPWPRPGVTDDGGDENVTSECHCKVSDHLGGSLLSSCCGEPEAPVEGASALSPSSDYALLWHIVPHGMTCVILDSPLFSPKMKNTNEPTRATVPYKFSSRRTFGWIQSISRYLQDYWRNLFLIRKYLRQRNTFYKLLFKKKSIKDYNFGERKYLVHKANENGEGRREFFSFLKQIFSLSWSFPQIILCLLQFLGQLFALFAK